MGGGKGACARMNKCLQSTLGAVCRLALTLLFGGTGANALHIVPSRLGCTVL